MTQTFYNQKVTLYDLIGMKRKNSVLKSVVLNSNANAAYSLCPIEVEAYDDTFINNTMYPSQQDRTYDVITRAIVKHQEKVKDFTGVTGKTIDVMHFSTFDRHHQQLLFFDEAKFH